PAPDQHAAIFADQTRPVKEDFLPARDLRRGRGLVAAPSLLLGVDVPLHPALAIFRVKAVGRPGIAAAAHALDQHAPLDVGRLDETRLDDFNRPHSALFFLTG